MSNLVPFDFKGVQIRAFEMNGEAWFVAKDVAESLGYANPSRSVKDHCKAAQVLKSTDTVVLDIPPRGLQIIPERDIYRLVMKSQLPAAEEFEEWVVGKVLPSIRKHGGYIVNQEKLTPEEIMANGLKAAESIIAEKQAVIDQQTAKLEETAPKAEFHDKVAAAPDALSVAKAAKILGTGRNRLLARLRQIGWVTRKNEPYQAKIEAGYLDVKLGDWEHPDHGIQQSVTTLITGKGLTRLQKELGGLA
ncbi:phage antirepressor KilAC domain-containing protein [Marinobacterium jannaschii]|uniref:phage antirepressor KilAC domain-containing protein n=1 Tax=Marinobacterium jannaschii TaxID=64970 RepID=UPI000687652F|nr:phage antirepressor KilAC domain-containing protein [Marinobacterium jannaschii]